MVRLPDPKSEVQAVAASFPLHQLFRKPTFALSIHPLTPTPLHTQKMAGSVAHFRHRKLYMLLAERGAKFAPWQLDRRKRQAKIIEWVLCVAVRMCVCVL